MKKPSPKKPTASDAGRRRPTDRPAENRPQAFSYHANRSAPREATPTRETDAPRPVNKRWWLTLIVLAGLFVVVSVQSTTPTIRTDGSADSKRLLQDEQVYQKAAASIIGSSTLNHIKYAVDTTAVASELRKQFPELTAVVVSETVFSNKPIVTVAGYEPALIISGADGSYVVDESGISRMTSARLPDSVRANLPIVTDQSGLSLEPGSAVLPSDNVEFINEIAAGLKAANVGYDQMTLPAATSELDVKIARESYFVKFALQGGASARQQLGTFLAAQAQVRGAGYVDVRVPERLYYK